MKRSFTILLSAMMTLTAVGSVVQAGVLTDLDKALTESAAWKYGDKDSSMKAIEAATFAAGKDAKLRAAAETKLIAALKSSKSVDLRRFICRQLRTIGTAEAIPVLASLLGDAELTHGARYALGRIEDPAAGAALHKAMGQTKGKIQAGIIVTLAKRGHTAALDDMVEMFVSSDKLVLHAAVRGVGVMGTSHSAKALLKARVPAKDELRKRMTDALLECADKLVACGKASDAAVVYKALYTPKEPAHIRLAALGGMARTRGDGAVDILVGAIIGDDPQMRASAIALMTEVKDPKATKVLVDMLGPAKPETQTLILASLGGRGDKSACPAVTKCAASEDRNVKAAALEALGSVGGAGSIPLLVKNAGTGGSEQSAQAALVAIKGPGVDDALIKEVASEDVKVSIEAIKALRARGCKKAADALFKAAVAKDANVRIAAIDALGPLTAKKDIERLLALLVKPADPKERLNIERSVGVLFLAVADSDLCASKVLAALKSIPGDARPSLIRMLARTPTPKALAAVQGAAKDSAEAVNDAAVRTLADWPDASAADAVIALAKSTSNKTHRVLLLRGYIRMAGTVKDSTDMCLRAMKLAESTQDKKLVLSGFKSAGTIKAFKEVAKHLDDKKTREEAALAAAYIGEKLKRSKDKEKVKTVLKKIQKFTRNNHTKKMVQRTIRDIK